MLKPAFVIPILQEKFPDFSKHQQVFLDTIYSLREKYPDGEYRSNRAGYQSPKNIHHQTEFEPLVTVLEIISRRLKREFNLNEDLILSEMWANIHDSRQCMNHQHVHGGVFSGCFYVSMPPGSGRILFTNPGLNPMWQGLGITNAPNQYTAESMHFSPSDGDLLLWPSFLPHGVETNDTDSARISIAFNFYRP